MSKTRYTQIELQQTITKGDIIQIVTPFIAGIGKLTRLDPNSLVVGPINAETLAQYIPAPPKEQVKQIGDMEFDNTPLTVPTTAIIALADINLIFKLTPNQ